MGFANPLVFAVFKNAQQLRLQIQGKFADFVEEQRAAVGVFKIACLGRLGAGKSTLGIAEQGWFEQGGRDGRTVECQERFGVAFGQTV